MAETKSKLSPNVEPQDIEEPLQERLRDLVANHGIMEITVTRIDTRRVRTVVVRDDGVSLGVPDYAFMRALPHDLAHYVVEVVLGLRRGFWGSVAEGAKFDGMVLIEGRQKPHAEQKGKAAVKLNAGNLNEAEILVSIFASFVDSGLDRSRQRVEARLKEVVARLRHTAPTLSWADVIEVCSTWRAMQSRWEALPVGNHIRLDWPKPERRAAMRHQYG
jgi:hypothetical protein